MGFDFLDFGFPKSGTDWKSINGKPYITVSSKGRSNGLSNKINDGADFGPDTTLGATSPNQTGAPYTKNSGLSEFVNYVEANGYVGRAFIKNGTYNIIAPIYLPSLYLSSGTLTLLKSDGTTISNPSISHIDISFIGESRDGVIFVMGDGVTSAIGGFQMPVGISNSVNTSLTIENMTPMPNPNYPLQTTFSGTHPINPTLFYLILSSIKLKNMHITAQYIGQGFGSAIFVGSSDGYSGFTEDFEDIKFTNSCGLGLNPFGRVTTYFKNIDLFNSGYWDDVISLNCNDQTDKQIIIIDGMYLGQDKPVPSDIATGGAAQLHLAGSTPNTMVKLTGKGIISMPLQQSSYQTILSEGFSGLDMDITAINSGIVLTNPNNSRIKFKEYITNSAFTANSIEVYGGFVNTVFDHTIYNTTGASVTGGNFNIVSNATITDSKIKIKMFGSSGINAELITSNGANSVSNLTLDGDVTDQLTAFPTYGIINNSLIPLTLVSPTMIPYGKVINSLGVTTPAVPTSGTAQENTNPYPVNVYLYGGVVTEIQITKNGTAYTVFSNASGLALSGQVYKLNPSDSITITYTTAPTWEWLSD